MSLGPRAPGAGYKELWLSTDVPLANNCGLLLNSNWDGADLWNATTVTTICHKKALFSHQTFCRDHPFWLGEENDHDVLW